MDLKWETVTTRAYLHGFKLVVERQDSTKWADAGWLWHLEPISGGEVVKAGSAKSLAEARCAAIQAARLGMRSRGAPY